MDKELIVASLKAKYPKESVEAIRSIAADIFYAGEDIDNDSIVYKLLSKWKDRQAQVKAQRVAAENPDICPICKRILTPIKLSKDRNAKWCQQHFVVLPTKSND